MRIKHVSFPIILAFILSSQLVFAQPPCQNGPDGIIYIQGGGGIQNYDPSLPISATNPVLNTIPNGGGGLAVANNLNGPGPSPTFYAASGGNWIYWNGIAWTNTGHSAGGPGAVNPGGGGNFIYNLIGSSGQVWQYDGTGPSTLLVTVPGFSGGGPYDLVGDCDGGFYILRTNATGTPGPFLRKYNSSGTLVQSWTATGTSNNAGGGFAIIGNTVYYHNGGGFHEGQLSTGPSISFSPNTAAIPNPSDMACCPVCNSGRDTVYYCEGAPGVGLSTILPPVVTWTVVSGNANVTGTGSNVSVTASATSIITATSNTSTDVDSFVVIPVPVTIDAGMNRTIEDCNPFSTTLNGVLLDTNGAFTYNIAWTPVGNITAGGATLSPAVTQTALTTYYMTVTTPFDEGGCLWRDSVTLDVNDFTPLANFDFELNLGCINDTVQFTNTSIENPSGAPSYVWNFDDGNIDIDENPLHIYGAQNTYNVNLQVTHNGCVDDTTIAVNVQHPLDADFIITNTGTAGDDSICLGQTFIFSPNTTPLAGTAGLVFDWDFDDGTTRLGQNSQQQIYDYTVPGVYNVKLVITDTLGCSDSISKTIFVDIPAFVALSATPTEICVGEKVYFADSVAPNTFNVTYDFDDGNVLSDLSNPVHTFEQSGTYEVNLAATYLICPDADTSVTIEVNDYARVNLGEDLSICPSVDSVLVLQDIENPAQILKWSTGVVAPRIQVNHNETGRYWAEADNKGCTGSDSIFVLRDCYLNIPNSFSPNGDGLNDYFIPRQLLSSGVIAFNMQIFNRWGELIFQTNQLDGRGWDGRYGGKAQSIGAFVYMIEATWKNGYSNSFRGTITLLK